MRKTSRHLWRVVVTSLAIATSNAASGVNPSAQTDRERTLNSELAGGWHLVRTPNPTGGADAISVTHTPDASRSDIDLAGLMIRCHERDTEVVIALLRAYPIRAKPILIFGKPGNETRLEPTVGAPGTVLLVPGTASALVDGLWREEKDLFLQIDDGQTSIHGVIPLAGLQSAFKTLAASCKTQ